MYKRQVEQWVGYDKPQCNAKKPPTYQPEPGATGDAALAGDCPFGAHSDGKACLLYTSKWGLDQEIEELAELNGTMKEGVAQGRPKMDSDIAAANMIMRVSPETNGSLAYNSWDFVEKQSGVPCKQLSEEHRGDKLTFFDLQIQSRKTFTAPDWSGTENDEIPYIAFWQNINLNLPWRTLTGRQHFYQDHEWMRAFGQEFPQYRPPADQRALAGYRCV